MSIFSDHDCGAMSDDEFRSACAEMNAQDREEKEHLEREEEEQEGMCLTCKHWKEVHLRKRYIASHPQYWRDRDGNRQSDEKIQVLYITQNDKDYETTAVCDKDMVETYEDYCCEDYEGYGMNCGDCILDGTDACSRGAGRAVNDEPCEDFIGAESEPQESESKRCMELAKSYLHGLRVGFAESEG